MRMRWLKYRLWRHNYVITVTSQTFSYHCVEYIKLDICAKFHDHRSNDNKVMMVGPSCPPPPNSALAGTTTGYIVNVVSTDAQKLDFVSTIFSIYFNIPSE